jgi:hypothetical protein
LKSYAPLEILTSDSGVCINQYIPCNAGLFRCYSFTELYLVWEDENETALQSKSKKPIRVIDEMQLPLFLKSLHIRISSIQELPALQIQKDTLIFEGNESEPTIRLESGKNRVSIQGASLPLNAFNFYQPILRWIDMRMSAGAKNLDLDFDLDFFDTQSAKMILEVMRKARELKTSGVIVTYRWHYAVDDHEMHEAGQDYESIIMHDFIFLPKNTVKESVIHE